MFVLDSSAIAVILRRLREKAVEVVGGNSTLDLAGYELGNIVWKECVFKGSITSEEAVKRAEEIVKVLGIMEVENVESVEDFMGVMKISTKLRTTFYDSSYLYIAKKKGFTLMTKDEELERKAEEIAIKTISVDEFLNKNL